MAKFWKEGNAPEDVTYDATQSKTILREKKDEYQDDLKSYRIMLKLFDAMRDFEDNKHLKSGGIDGLLGMNNKDIARVKVQELYDSLKLKRQRYLIKTLHNIEEALYKRGAKMDILDL